jgi:hypothetical protein
MVGVRVAVHLNQEFQVLMLLAVVEEDLVVMVELGQELLVLDFLEGQAVLIIPAAVVVLVELVVLGLMVVVVVVV